MTTTHSIFRDACRALPPLVRKPIDRHMHNVERIDAFMAGPEPVGMGRILLSGKSRMMAAVPMAYSHEFNLSVFVFSSMDDIVRFTGHGEILHWFIHPTNIFCTSRMPYTRIVWPDNVPDNVTPDSAHLAMFCGGGVYGALHELELEHRLTTGLIGNHKMALLTTYDLLAAFSANLIKRLHRARVFAAFDQSEQARLEPARNLIFARPFYQKALFFFAFPPSSGTNIENDVNSSGVEHPDATYSMGPVVISRGLE